jgi:hypothetical protein
MHAHQECVCECRTWKMGVFSGRKQTPQCRASASAIVRSGTDGGGAMPQPQPEDPSRFVSRPRPTGVVGRGSHPADGGAMPQPQPEDPPRFVSRPRSAVVVGRGSHPADGGAMPQPQPEDPSRFVSRPRPAGVVGRGSHPADGGAMPEPQPEDPSRFVSHPADIHDPVAITSAVSLRAAHVRFRVRLARLRPWMWLCWWLNMWGS